MAVWSDLCEAITPAECSPAQIWQELAVELHAADQQYSHKALLHESAGVQIRTRSCLP